MTEIKEFELRHGVRLRCKSDLWWARAIGKIWPRFMLFFWTTVRWPGQQPTIAYPSGVSPMRERYRSVRAHEIFHCNQMRSTVGLAWTAILYFLVPLPVFFSGRWFVERRPYLGDIKNGAKTVDSAVQTLWESYAWPWPKPLMRRWFKRQLG